MRDKLIELILECSTYTPEYSEQARLHAEYLAQHLLNEGVIVPPCKVGQMVYYPIHHTNKVAELVVREIVCAGGEIKLYASYLVFTVDAIGKTVFLTREEAERALTERSEE